LTSLTWARFPALGAIHESGVLSVKCRRALRLEGEPYDHFIPHLHRRRPCRSGFGLLASAASAQTVNIYSYRQPDLIKPVLDAFTAETGVKTEVLFLDKGLEERMAAEGAIRRPMLS
jgi:hypothetical protein